MSIKDLSEIVHELKKTVVYQDNRLNTIEDMLDIPRKVISQSGDFGYIDPWVDKGEVTPPIHDTAKLKKFSRRTPRRTPRRNKIPSTKKSKRRSKKGKRLSKKGKRRSKKIKKRLKKR